MRPYINWLTTMQRTHRLYDLKLDRDKPSLYERSVGDNTLHLNATSSFSSFAIGIEFLRVVRVVAREALR